MNPEPRGTDMIAHRPTRLLAVVLAVTALVGACGSSSGPLGSVPAATSSPDPSVAQGAPAAPPAPSAEPSSDPTTSADASTSPGPSTSPTPSGTIIVRAYLWLGGAAGTEGLVAVLREIP